jgi:hypothetical protein
MSDEYLLKVLWAGADSYELEPVGLQELRALGYSVHAVNLDSAWEQLGEEPFDLVVVDDREVEGMTVWWPEIRRLSGVVQLPRWIIWRTPGYSERTAFALELKDGGRAELTLIELMRDNALGDVGPLLDRLVVMTDKAGSDSNVVGPLEQVFRRVSRDALRHLADDPGALARMHHRAFEHLVAHLFERDGFDVTLTGRSRDGGVDIYAAKHTVLGPLLYVVECKRYRLDRPVSPGFVRQLRGVVDRESANAGVLATTSFFSSGAREEQRTIPFRLSLLDNHDIRAWILGDQVI